VVLQIFGDVVGQTFALNTESDKTFEALELLGFSLLGILPAAVEFVLVLDLELVDEGVALVCAICF
jgi:hypothetical protein